MQPTVDSTRFAITINTGIIYEAHVIEDYLLALMFVFCMLYIRLFLHIFVASPLVNTRVFRFTNSFQNVYCLYLPRVSTWARPLSEKKFQNVCAKTPISQPRFTKRWPKYRIRSLQKNNLSHMIMQNVFFWVFLIAKYTFVLRMQPQSCIAEQSIFRQAGSMQKVKLRVHRQKRLCKLLAKRNS